MTHFDFKTLLPALLQVEDRVSMAHGLESRVPLLDHPLVELAATVPADVKFPGGELKHVFKRATRAAVPDASPSAPTRWAFRSRSPSGSAAKPACPPQTCWRPAAASRTVLFDNRQALAGLDREARFGRKIWGLLSLELWQQRFHDREHDFKRLLTDDAEASEVSELRVGRSAGG